MRKILLLFPLLLILLACEVPSEDDSNNDGATEVNLGEWVTHFPPTSSFADETIYVLRDASSFSVEVLENLSYLHPYPMFKEDNSVSLFYYEDSEKVYVESRLDSDRDTDSISVDTPRDIYIEVDTDSSWCAFRLIDGSDSVTSSRYTSDLSDDYIYNGPDFELVVDAEPSGSYESYSAISIDTDPDHALVVYNLDGTPIPSTTPASEYMLMNSFYVGGWYDLPQESFSIDVEYLVVYFDSLQSISRSYSFDKIYSNFDDISDFEVGKIAHFTGSFGNPNGYQELISEITIVEDGTFVITKNETDTGSFYYKLDSDEDYVYLGSEESFSVASGDVLYVKAVQGSYWGSGTYYSFTLTME